MFLIFTAKLGPKLDFYTAQHSEYTNNRFKVNLCIIFRENLIILVKNADAMKINKFKREEKKRCQREGRNISKILVSASLHQIGKKSPILCGKQKSGF